MRVAVRVLGRLVIVILFCGLAIILAAAGCSERLPLAPDASASATISGWVYASVNWADPPVPDAHIEVHAADGSKTTTVSDLHGFYHVCVRPGSVVITTSKEGYDATTYQVMLLTDTTLNFFLDPR